jgi:hypothetical protein
VRVGGRSPLSVGGLRSPKDGGKANLIAYRVIRPDLGGIDLMIREETACAVDAPCRHVQVKLHVQAGKRLPLRHRLEVVDRLRRLYLDDADELAGTLR